MNPKEHIKHVHRRTFYGEFLRTQSISLWALWFMFSPIFHKTFDSTFFSFSSLIIIYNLPEFVKQLLQLITSTITHHLKYL